MAKYTITNQPEPIPFEENGSIVARTVQNAKNLLMTQMGEVPYDRLRGFNPALYHLPLPDMQAALLPEVNRLMMWEPDAKVAQATAAMLANGEILITVIIDVNVGE